MPAQWTGEVVSKMHIFEVTKQQLAAELGVTPAYVGMVLNGRREPKGAEQQMKSALECLITRKTAALDNVPTTTPDERR